MDSLTRSAIMDHYDPMSSICSTVQELQDRCFFIEDVASGEVVGTTTAWRGDLGGRNQGRLHWVAVKSSHMGLGLAKVLLSVALQHLRSMLPTPGEKAALQAEP